jgi:hypothetical protein
MVSLKRLLPILFLALGACAQPPEPPTPAPGAVQEEVASLWTADTRTILTGDAARALTHQCSRASPGPITDVWTPTDAEIAALEDALILRVASELEQRGESPSPGDYYRQYAGFVIGGKRIVYANGVSETAIEREPNPAHPFDWRTQAVQICDGGSITFGVEYDPATRQFSNFAFNGAL